MRRIGLIPRKRLQNIPPELRAKHEYCFFLHDQCLRALKEYEHNKAHHVSVEFSSKLTAAQFENLAAEDPIEALQATGYPNEAKRVILNHITMAMISDFLHHVFEAFKCLEKRKIIVALNLLRKPLKDNLLYLSWMLADENDFYNDFTLGDPEKLTPKKVGKQRVDIFAKAAAKTDISHLIDASVLNFLLYDKKNPDGFEILFQHAVHLVTVERLELRTSPENFNFIFKDPSDADIYLSIYNWMPYIMLCLTHVIMGLFDKIHPMDEGARVATLVRTVVGFGLVEKYESSFALEIVADALPEHIGCNFCQFKLRLRACLKRVLRSAWLHDSPRQLQLMG